MFVDSSHLANNPLFVEELLQSKWSYLKVKYKNEVGLEMQFGDRYISKWYLYNSMEFLKDHFQKVLKSEVKSENFDVKKQIHIPPSKVYYLSTLLEEIRDRPLIWVPSRNPTDEIRARINQNWEDIAKVIERLREFLCFFVCF